MKLSIEGTRALRTFGASMRHVEGCRVCNGSRRTGRHACEEGQQLFGAYGTALDRWREQGEPSQPMDDVNALVDHVVYCGHCSCNLDKRDRCEAHNALYKKVAARVVEGRIK